MAFYPLGLQGLSIYKERVKTRLGQMEMVLCGGVLDSSQFLGTFETQIPQNADWGSMSYDTITLVVLDPPGISLFSPYLHQISRSSSSISLV